MRLKELHAVLGDKRHVFPAHTTPFRIIQARFHGDDHAGFQGPRCAGVEGNGLVGFQAHAVTQAVGEGFFNTVRGKVVPRGGKDLTRRHARPHDVKRFLLGFLHQGQGAGKFRGRFVADPESAGLIGTVSLNSEIAYLGSAKGDRLTAEAFCIKNGRTTSYYRIEVRDEFDNLAAIVNTTGYKKA